ncbi:patatin-like phospholipase family protein [Porphyromonas loveana]|uniref:patatin-like phospholipase family protein n=1 Tax=Porphyromonas loveana TaxID=1884669 RepID=UPI0035A03608
MTERTKATAPFRIGVALSGGAAKGFAHLGVLQALEECGKRPDIIAGNSAGAIVAALYADGYRPEEIIDLFMDRDFRAMTQWQLPQKGFFETRRLLDFLRATLRHQFLEDLPLTVRIVATDLDHGTIKVFASGPLADIVLASSSVPVLFNPVVIDGVTYVDGGLFKNLPASVLRDDCQYLIGVHLNPKQPTEYKKNIIGIAERSFAYIYRANAMLDRELCDLLIEPRELSHFKLFSVESARELAAIGYQETLHALNEASETPT